MRAPVGWAFAVVVVMILAPLAQPSSAAPLSTASLVFTAAPAASLALTPVGVQPLVSANLQNILTVQLNVYMWVDVENSQNQTVGVFLGSSTIQAGRNATIDSALLNLLPGNYTALIYATTTSGIVLSNTAILTFFYTPRAHVLGTDTFTIVQPPVFCTPICPAGMGFVKVVYRNNLNSTVTALVYANIYNPIGQTAGVRFSTISVAAGENVTASVTVYGIGVGSFSAVVFAVTPQGVVISGNARVNFTIPS